MRITKFHLLQTLATQHHLVLAKTGYHGTSHVNTFCQFSPSWNWERLSESYKKSAYLSTDIGALDTFFYGSSTDVDNQLPDNFTPEEDNTM